MNNAELIVKTLRAAGVSHGFGIPSGNVLPLLEAMRVGRLPYVLTAHEGSAAFAADVMGRMTGAPGLCIATLGPGATNLTTGVGNAYLDRSPLLAITCNLPTSQLGRRIQMAIDHHALFRPITKATLPLREGQVASVLAEAIEIALSEPLGPVHLDLPEDVAMAPAKEDVPSIAGGRRLPRAGASSLERAAELLRASRRPVVVLGSSAMRVRKPELLRSVIERHRLPFASTTMAKGMISEAHALSLGCIERARRQVQRELLRGADLIVGIGYDVVEVEYEAWIGKVPLLSIDVDPVDADASVTITHGWSSMGFGLPAAIAAKLARPDRPVVALIGDGCFQMTAGEVAVARRLGLALPIVVLDDGWLSLIQVKQVRRHFGLYGTDLGEHEHVDPPAHYFGVPAVGVRSAAALTRALQEALVADHPTVI